MLLFFSFLIKEFISIICQNFSQLCVVVNAKQECVAEKQVILLSLYNAANQNNE